jgi:hypothetical protein
VVLIFLILFALYGNFKFPVIVVLSVILTEPVGALLALKLTGTPFSVSSILGLLVLMGVSVETAVIDTSYINKLRLAGQDIPESARIVAIVDVYDALTHDRVYRQISDGSPGAMRQGIPHVLPGQLGSGLDLGGRRGQIGCVAVVIVRGARAELILHAHFPLHGSGQV